MSRFVAGGTSDDKPTERSEEWLKAQQAIEAKQLDQKLAAAGRQEGGKSLYETLQANKAAKQDAFEESIRLKNQFRALDDDEVDFLEAVNEQARSRDDAVRRETAEQLGHFREQQARTARPLLHDGRKADGEAVDDDVKGSWAVPRKRKRERGGQGVVGVKLRKQSSSAGGDNKPLTSSPPAVEARPEPVTANSLAEASLSPAPAAAGLGLAGYSSSDDE